MTNETPENQSPASGGQHGFDAFTSSAPAEPAAPAAADVPAEPVVGSAADPVAPAPSQPEVAAPEIVVPPAPEVIPPAAEATPPAPDAATAFPAPGVPASFPVPGAEQAPPYAAAQDPGQTAPGEPQPYPGAAAPAYPAPDQGQAYPTQAYPAPDQTQAYPGAATAAYPAGGYDPNAPQYATAAYPLPAPAPKKPMSKGLLWGLVGGGVALVLIIAAAIIVPIALRGPQLTAGDVVENYLTAISEGDAEAAMEYIDPYGDEDLLTDEVLKASLELAPISGIEIGEYDEDRYDSTVPVTFSIGETTVEREFDVYNYDDDWQISDGVTSVYLPSGFEGLGLTINGVEAPESAYVFPGTYEFAVDNEAFAFEGGASVFTIADDEDTEELWELTPVLSESGITTFQTLVKDAINECVAMKTLSTPCGWDISDIDLSGATPIEGTVTRTLTADGKSALENLTPEYYSGTTVTTYDSVDVDMTLEGESGGKRGTYEVWWGGYLGSPVVDFGTETPTLTWE
ncbi:nuclear transport factor 2 family protein [Microbacterium tumbae]